MANPNGNPQNLKRPGDPKFHELTLEDKKKGAEISNRKQGIMRLLDKYAQLKITDQELIDKMRDFGITDESLVNEGAIAVQIVSGAAKGDPKMIDTYLETTGQKVTHSINENYNADVTPLVDLTKRQKNGE